MNGPPLIDRAIARDTGVAARPRPVWWVALRDFAHDWRISLVAVLGVTVALAPLVILLGLKLGVVDTLRAALASDPRNLELRIPGGNVQRFDAGWFERIAARPETGFVIPMTRGTVAQIYLRNRADRDVQPARVSVIPTAAGDPVLERAGVPTPTAEAIVLSAPAARALGAATGTVLEAVIDRLDDGQRRAVFLDLTVAATLPPEAEGRAAAYAALPLAVAIEDYREWQAVPRYGWEGRAPIDDPFADFRLYARSIDAVEPLRRMLADEGLEVESRAADIAAVRRIDADLSLMFAAILGLTLVGFATTLALNQLAAVDRKRKTLAVLRLLGYPGRALMLFPVVQGSAIGLLGAAAALAVFAVMDPVIGALFAEVIEARGSLTRLPAAYVALALAGSVAVAAVASLAAAARILRISPSTELKNG